MGFSYFKYMNGCGFHAEQIYKWVWFSCGGNIWMEGVFQILAAPLYPNIH